jgi:hypothetical protein
VLQVLRPVQDHWEDRLRSLQALASGVFLNTSHLPCFTTQAGASGDCRCLHRATRKCRRPPVPRKGSSTLTASARRPDGTPVTHQMV